MKISIVIPTYEREKDLNECLDSIIIQTTLPKEIIVIDDSPNNSIKFLIKRRTAEFGDKNVLLKYIKNPKERSLTIARNVGIENATGDIILFLDSDVVLDKDYINEIVKVYEKYPDTLGVQGYVTNMNYSTVMNAINKFFFFNFLEKTKCRILPSGFPTYPYALKQIVFCQWLSGTNHSYRRSVFKEYRYDEKLRKYSLSEDKDMSYRIFKTHFNSLLIVPYATLIHKHSKEGRIPKKQMVYMKQIYSLYFFYKNMDPNVKNKIIFLWSRIGYLLCNFGLFLLKPSKTKWLKWKYIICAYVLCIRHLKEIKSGNLDFFNKSLETKSKKTEE